MREQTLKYIALMGAVALSPNYLFSRRDGCIGAPDFFEIVVSQVSDWWEEFAMPNIAIV